MIPSLHPVSWQKPRPSRAQRTLPKMSEGHFVVTLTFGEEKHGEGQILGCESLLEYRAALCLIYRADFADIREQVGPIHLPPPNHKRDPLYLDFLFTDTRGQRTAISVKPEAIAVTPYFKAQMQALRAALVPNQADRLVVVTEANISGTDLANAQLMHAARFPVPEVDRAVARVLAKLSTPLPLDAVMREVDRPGEAFFGVVRALRHGDLAWDRRERITPTTVVWPATKGLLQ